MGLRKGHKGRHFKNSTDRYEIVGTYLKNPVPDLKRLDLSPREADSCGDPVTAGELESMPGFKRNLNGKARDLHSSDAYSVSVPSSRSTAGMH